MTIEDAYVDLETGEIVDFRRFVAGSRWRLAQTKDHEWTLRDLDHPGRSTCLSSGSFSWAVAYIRQHGYVGYFGRRAFMYFEIDGWKFWSMNAPVELTTIVNRAPIEQEAAA